MNATCQRAVFIILQVQVGIITQRINWIESQPRPNTSTMDDIDIIVDTWARSKALEVRGIVETNAKFSAGLTIRIQNSGCEVNNFTELFGSFQSHLWGWTISWMLCSLIHRRRIRRDI